MTASDYAKALTKMDQEAILGEHMFFVSLPGGARMGQATRKTKLPLDQGQRTQGGANTDKHAFLDATVQVLNAARAFYVDFFLAHADKLSERVCYYSQQHLELLLRAISANELLTWAERHTVATEEHPHPWPSWNFSTQHCQRLRQVPRVHAALRATAQDQGQSREQVMAHEPPASQSAAWQDQRARQNQSLRARSRDGRP
jgi:hypothetical protein